MTRDTKNQWKHVRIIKVPLSFSRILPEVIENSFVLTITNSMFFSFPDKSRRFLRPLTAPHLLHSGSCELRIQTIKSQWIYITSEFGPRKRNDSISQANFVVSELFVSMEIVLSSGFSHLRKEYIPIMYYSLTLCICIFLVEDYI